MISTWPRILDRGRICLHSDATLTCVACNTPFAYSNQSREYIHSKKCKGEDRQEVPREVARADANENAILQNLPPTQWHQRMRERLQHAQDVQRSRHVQATSPEGVNRDTAPVTRWSGLQQTRAAQPSPAGTRSNHEMDWSPARKVGSRAPVLWLLRLCHLAASLAVWCPFAGQSVGHVPRV